MRRLLGLAAVLWLLPAMAHAVPDTPYAPDTMFLYPQLTQSQQLLFDLFYAAAVKGEERVSLPAGSGYDDACTAMDALLDDCPELCALDGQYKVGYLQATPEKAEYVELSYCMPVEEQLQMVILAREMADGAYGDEFQREWYLHDALCRRVSYDLTARHQHNAWGALVEGRAVCDGYAKAMALLLRLSDIQCGIIYGKADAGSTLGGHTWNIVRISSAYTLLDVTYDDQGEVISYAYFNLTDQEMGVDHFPDGTWTLPACTDESVNWHVRRNLTVTAQEGSMEQQMFNSFRNMALYGQPLHLKFDRGEDFLAFADYTQRWLDWYNMQCDTAQTRLNDEVRFCFVRDQRCAIAYEIEKE